MVVLMAAQMAVRWADAMVYQKAAERAVGMVAL